MPPPTTSTSKSRAASRARSRITREYLIVGARWPARSRSSSQRAVRDLLGHAHPRSRRHHASAGLARVLRRSRAVSFRKAASSAAARAFDGIAAGACSKSAAAPAAISSASRRAAPTSPASTSRPRRSRLPAQNFAQEGLPASFRSPTARQLPFPDARSISCTPTASCSTRPTIARSSPSAAACCRPGGDGDLSGLQPDFMAECVVAGHEGRPRARGRAGAEEIFDRRVSRVAEETSRASASCPNAFR